MTWLYEQTTGRLYRPDGTHAGTGYAGGNCGKSPEGINNHKMQSIKSIGPVPCGFYILDEPVLQSHLGPFAIPLIPDGANEMFGRGHFYIHGDTTPSGNASQGCIIQARAVRKEMWASEDHRLEVKP
jgi:hypothetical protein